MYSYLAMTADVSMRCFVDSADQDTMEMHCYPDADLAGTFDTSRATGGGFCHLKGLNTFCPIGLVF